MSKDIKCNYGWYINFDSDPKTRYSRTEIPLYSHGNSTEDVCRFGCYIQPECISLRSKNEEGKQNEKCISKYDGQTCSCFVNTDRTKLSLHGNFRSYYSYKQYKEKEAFIVKKLFTDTCVNSSPGQDCIAYEI